MSHKLWGEMIDVPEPSSDLTAIEVAAFRALLTKLSHPIAVEGAKFYVPLSQTKHISYSTGVPCEITKHTILLKLFSYELMDLLELARQQENNRVEGTHCGLPVPPPMPLLKECVMSHRQPGDITGLDHESDFVQGNGVSPPILPFKTMREIKNKAISAIFCQIGYEYTTHGIFDILMDVLHDFYLQVMRILRKDVDKEALIGCPVYVDVLEQMFHEIGFGSLTELHHFYQETVVQRHQYMQAKCEWLLNEYKKLRAPEIEPKEEVSSDKVKAPATEIQFPVLDEMEDNQAPHMSLQLEELQGALQNNEPEGSYSLKDDSMKWPPNQNIKKEELAPPGALNLDPEELLNVADSTSPTQADTEVSPPNQPVEASESNATNISQLGKPLKKKKKLI